MEPTACVVRCLNDEQIATVRKLWACGVSMRLIGYEVGRTRSAVAGYVTRLKLPKRRNADSAPPPKVKRHRTMTKRTVVTTQRLNVKPFMGGPTVFTHGVYVGATYEAPDTRKTLLELGPDDCRWPCWNDGDAEKFFCGAPQAGLSYCRDHCAIAYNQTPRLTRVREEFERAA